MYIKNLILSVSLISYNLICPQRYQPVICFHNHHTVHSIVNCYCNFDINFLTFCIVLSFVHCFVTVSMYCTHIHTYTHSVLYCTRLSLYSVHSYSFECTLRVWHSLPGHMMLISMLITVVEMNLSGVGVLSLQPVPLQVEHRRFPQQCSCLMLWEH